MIAALGSTAKVAILRQWYHETRELCREQFRSRVRERLDDLGIGASAP